MAIVLKAILKMLLWAVSSLSGLAAGGLVMTTWVAVANYLAQDGPIFPAPLVAFVVVAPISFTLFLMQGIALAYEFFAGRRLGNILLWIGLAGGVAAGLLPYALAVAPYQSDPKLPAALAFGGLGIFQGLVVFGFHRAANGATTFILRRGFGESTGSQETKP